MGILAKDGDFYSLHGIWGAYASIVLGRLGRGAGVVVGDVQPPKRALFAGYRRGTEKPVLLPFAPDVKVGRGVEAYTGEQAHPDAAAHPEVLPGRVPFEFFGEEDIERTLSLSGETWAAGRMKMNVVSFFGEVPDPASSSKAVLRDRMCPAIYVRLSFDNSGSDSPMVGVFGMQGIRRPLSDANPGRLLGFAHVGEWGFATAPAPGVSEVMDWMAIAAAFSDKPHVMRHLASDGCLRFEVAPGERKEYVVAVGAYRDGVVTAGMRMRSYQATLFRDLDDVLVQAVSRARAALGLADGLDRLLDAAPISGERKFLAAHAVHSYLASTELLADEAGKPVFIVNEGEYQMMNTLDLTVDQAFHELAYSPWTVKNELDFLMARSSYRDAFGIAVTHDQGVADCFSPRGTSSYELPGLTGCFSFMSYEETLNWILIACLYSHNADDGSWLRKNRKTLSGAVESILNRDENGDGIMDRDSDRCAGGAEITTYDSLDVSLGQARNNLYIATKAWAGLVCAASTLDAVGGRDLAARARASAARIAETVLARVVEPEGFIPAVFEGGNQSRIIPAVEGLVYPALCGVAEAVRPDGEYGPFVRALKRHLEAVLVPGVCLDPVSGGWKLSSTSRNTWPSKVFISQYVAENLLGIRDERTARDAAHVRWQCVGCADFAATDQLDSSTGADMGSRLYPRLVSSVLWYKTPTKRGKR